MVALAVRTGSASSKELGREGEAVQVEVVEGFFAFCAAFDYGLELVHLGVIELACGKSREGEDESNEVHS